MMAATDKTDKLVKYLTRAGYDCDGFTEAELQQCVEGMPDEWQEALENGKGKVAVLHEMVASISEELFEAEEAAPTEVPPEVVVGLVRMVDQYGGERIADCVSKICEL
jgi:hypothetical protein